MNTMYPLSKGLLISMALRSNHDFSLGKEANELLSSGFTNEERIVLLDNMYELYLKLVNDHQNLVGTEAQLFEEIVGMGFYSPTKEESYSGQWPINYSPSYLNTTTLFRCNNCCEEFEAHSFSEHTCTPIGNDD